MGTYEDDFICLQFQSPRLKGCSAHRAMSVPREALKRLAKDVRDVMRDSSLTEMGIHYAHSERNILYGEALIVGPADSIYEDGLFLFAFHFPTSYPHAPPRCTILTGDGRTRLHPNLYRNGKVCLSLLNTWAGPSWTGCQSIRTVLLTLLTSVLSSTEPILHEPGVKRSHVDFVNYHRIVDYAVPAVCVLQTLSAWPGSQKALEAEGRAHAARRREAIIARIASKCQGQQEVIAVRTMLYNLTCLLDYEKLLRQAEKQLPKLK